MVPIDSVSLLSLLIALAALRLLLIFWARAVAVDVEEALLYSLGWPLLLPVGDEVLSP